MIRYYNACLCPTKALFPCKPALASPPGVFFLHLCPKITSGPKCFYRSDALLSSKQQWQNSEGNSSTDPIHQPGLVLSSSTTTRIRIEIALAFTLALTWRHTDEIWLMATVTPSATLLTAVQHHSECSCATRNQPSQLREISSVDKSGM